MPEYKLTYFNSKGITEPIRYIFAWCGVDFEDVRIDKDDWPLQKANMPYGQLPTLDTGDAFILTQSVPIARYLGNVFNLGSDDLLKNAQLDAVVDHLKDLYKQMAQAKADDKLDEFESTTLPFYFNKFNAVSAGGFFYGTEISWVDIYFAGFIDSMESRLGKELLGEFSNLNAIKTKINRKETIQNYLEKRPFSAM